MYAGSTAARTIDFGARWKRAIAATAALRDFGPPYDGFGSKAALGPCQLQCPVCPKADTAGALGWLYRTPDCLDGVKSK
jgi:hypothetical protein